ncbi:unnamed protein product [Pleuronectes platessa]|uniref:Uncharacterized protein n=1 Tax=Pleuronectes platessa TaxID=8262 RepID=A0A9N7TWQ5_PLEPL|nr:unnamed protein product [Pleuronectes platessa]
MAEQVVLILQEGAQISEREERSEKEGGGVVRSSAQSEVRWTSGEPGARAKEGRQRKETEARQSPAEPQTADERSRVRVRSPLRFPQQPKAASGRPEPARNMMLKLLHLVGMLVCSSQGKTV